VHIIIILSFFEEIERFCTVVIGIFFDIVGTAYIIFTCVDDTKFHLRICGLLIFAVRPGAKKTFCTTPITFLLF